MTLIPMEYQKESVGITLASQMFGARFFENSATMSGVYEHPNKLSDPAYERLQKGLDEKYTGVQKAHKAAILEEGMKFREISWSLSKILYLIENPMQLNH